MFYPRKSNNSFDAFDLCECFKSLMNVSGSFGAVWKRDINWKTGAEKYWNILHREQTEVWTGYSICFYSTFDSILKSFPVPVEKKRRESRQNKATKPTRHSRSFGVPHFLGKLIIPFSLQLCLDKMFASLKALNHRQTTSTNYISFHLLIILLSLFVIHLIRLLILFWTSKVHKEQKPKFCVVCIKSMRVYHNVFPRIDCEMEYNVRGFLPETWNEERQQNTHGSCSHFFLLFAFFRYIFFPGTNSIVKSLTIEITKLISNMLNMLDKALRNSSSQHILKETSKIEPKNKKKWKRFISLAYKKRRRNSQRLNHDTNNRVVRKTHTHTQTDTGKSQVER